MKVLSGLTTSFFNAQNINAPDKFELINKLMESMDADLDENYDAFFASFLKTAKDFLGMGDLKVRSNLKASEIISDASEVVYGDDATQLPEYLNGLGHMNILYLLLNIEIKKNKFLANKKDIKLLFIEEPEAHTHPQLQYIFARKICEILSDISGMQTIITTHSPHIVASHPFKNFRYMSTVTDLKAAEKELSKTEHSLSNLLAAIEAGMLTETTKERLTELELTKKELKELIAIEKSKEIKLITANDIRQFVNYALSQPTQVMIELLVQKIIVVNDIINLYLRCEKTRLPTIRESGLKRIYYKTPTELFPIGAFFLWSLNITMTFFLMVATLYLESKFPLIPLLLQSKFTYNTTYCVLNSIFHKKTTI